MTADERRALCPICHPGALGSVCTQCLGVAPMRRVNECVCLVCAHEWIAPKRGNCPKCHSDQTMAVVERTNGLKRL